MHQCHWVNKLVHQLASFIFCINLQVFFFRGHMFLGDNFNSALFRQSLQVVFNRDQNGHFFMAFNANLEVKVRNFAVVPFMQ